MTREADDGEGSREDSEGRSEPQKLDPEDVSKVDSVTEQSSRGKADRGSCRNEGHDSVNKSEDPKAGEDVEEKQTPQVDSTIDEDAAEDDDAGHGGNSDRLPFERPGVPDGQDYADDHCTFVAPWIRVNFPEVTSEEELKSLASASEQGGFTTENMSAYTEFANATVGAGENDGTNVCEECSTRSVSFFCEDCSLALCFNCTDAIHIIASLSAHKVLLGQHSDTITTVSSARTEARFQDDWPPQDPPSLPPPRSDTVMEAAEPPPSVATTQLEETRLALPAGTSVFFRAADCARWPRELLHGTLLCPVSAITSSGDEFYHRVLWLRGVEALPNGFYRASLALPGWESGDGDGDYEAEEESSGDIPCWPQEIGVFPTQLGALRAVVTAEKIARSKFRRELAGGRIQGSTSFSFSEVSEATLDDAFPSCALLNEIIEETLTTLGREFAVRLTRQDDAVFHTALSRGTWDFRRWMESIGRAESLREEDAVTFQDTAARRAASKARETSDFILDGKVPAMPTPWPPATRFRYFLVAQRDLVFPERVCRQHLRAILDQLLFVYAGFAWQRWRDFVERHRAWETAQRRDKAARELQAWIRRLLERRRQQTRQLALLQQKQTGEDGGDGDPLLTGALGSSVEVLELYRRRQAEARKLHAFFTRQVEERQRNTLHKWRDVLGPPKPPPASPTTWHPSHGMKTLLPKLPRVGARRRLPQEQEQPGMAPGNQLVVEDAQAFRLFRANHAGPTDASYWVVRGRVLAGVCPVGPAFREARRLVARADFATSILLQEVSVFVCLLEASELREMEPATADPAAEWLYERQVRRKFESLRTELQGAETTSKRLVQLSRQTLADFDVNVASAAAEAVGHSAAHGRDKKRRNSLLPPLPTVSTSLDEEADEETELAMVRESLAQKLQLAEQQAEKAKREARRLATMQLEFLHFPIAHDNVPTSEQELLDFLSMELESRLRAGKNLYVFSRLGHGRTGLVAALLLGRIYGLKASEALERAQRLHDCQRLASTKGPGARFCSPTTAAQVALVRRALAGSIDTIYAPLVLENSDTGFHTTRTQQRGLLAEPFLRADGFMVSAAADESTREREANEQKRLQRVARRESAAGALQRERRQQQQERDAMLLQDVVVADSVGKTREGN